MKRDDNEATVNVCMPEELLFLGESALLLAFELAHHKGYVGHCILRVSLRSPWDYTIGSSILRPLRHTTCVADDKFHVRYDGQVCEWTSECSSFRLLSHLCQNFFDITLENKNIVSPEDNRYVTFA